MYICMYVCMYVCIGSTAVSSVDPSEDEIAAYDNRRAAAIVLLGAVGKVRVSIFIDYICTVCMYVCMYACIQILSFLEAS
jgi:hypothetical protein